MHIKIIIKFRSLFNHLNHNNKFRKEIPMRRILTNIFQVKFIYLRTKILQNQTGTIKLVKDKNL